MMVRGFNIVCVCVCVCVRARTRMCAGTALFQVCAHCFGCVGSHTCMKGVLCGTETHGVAVGLLFYDCTWAAFSHHLLHWGCWHTAACLQHADECWLAPFCSALACKAIIMCGKQQGVAENDVYPQRSEQVILHNVECDDSFDVMGVFLLVLTCELHLCMMAYGLSCCSLLCSGYWTVTAGCAVHDDCTCEWILVCEANQSIVKCLLPGVWLCEVASTVCCHLW